MNHYGRLIIIKIKMYGQTFNYIFNKLGLYLGINGINIRYKVEVVMQYTKHFMKTNVHNKIVNYEIENTRKYGM